MKHVKRRKQGGRARRIEVARGIGLRTRNEKQGSLRPVVTSSARARPSDGDFPAGAFKVPGRKEFASCCLKMIFIRKVAIAGLFELLIQRGSLVRDQLLPIWGC